jgi:uncharacterized cupin superfamily protein
MTTITQRQATAEEQRMSQYWDVWESGQSDHFEYCYDRDVQFVVQSGDAVIHSPGNAPISIGTGDHVTIRQGVEGRWAIRSPVVNRYRYL